MKYSYAWEKFFLAAHSLALSSKSPNERLADAYIFNLIHLTPDDLPRNVRNDFKKLQQVLTTKEPVGDEGRVVATTSAMNELQVIEAIKSIMSMYDQVARAYGE